MCLQVSSGLAGFPHKGQTENTSPCADLPGSPGNVKATGQPGHRGRAPIQAYFQPTYGQSNLDSCHFHESQIFFSFQKPLKLTHQ